MYPDLIRLALFNIAYSALLVFVMFLSVVVFDAVCWRDFSFKDEIKAGNLAVAVFVGLVVLGVCIRTAFH